MSDDRDEMRDLALAYSATRDILRARDADSAQSTLLALCRALGAEVATAEGDAAGSLPIDLCVGEGEPLLPVSDDPRVERATRDPLTGLWSRRSLTMAVNRLRGGDCIAMLDLDHFKSINDTLGHAAGDAVLAAFGRFLRVGVRDQDIVGRLGGEEFVVIFPQTSIDQALVVLERLRSSWPAAAPQRSTFSTGLAQVNDGSGGGDEAGQRALQVADGLMYEAKSAGRDRIVSAS